tara:strand:+ start:9406 stop:9726 length:321 start_codon:yes stop_codon:yes gene_type:complete
MKIQQPELILIAIGIAFFILYFQARSATNLQEKEAGTDFKGKIRTVCASTALPDLCIANGDAILNQCTSCITDPSDPLCNQKIEMPQGLAEFEGSFSCNELKTKLN